MVDLVEGLEQRRQVVAAEIGHQPRQLVVGARLDQPRHRALVADLVAAAACARPRRPGTPAPSRAGSGSCRSTAAALRRRARVKAASLQRAVFEDHHVPAEVLEQLLVALPQALADHGVEALAVVVDDPPAVAQALLPAFEHRLEDVALVELGVADQRDHAAFGPVEAPAVGAHIVLHQRGEQRLRDAEADRAGGEIDVVGVLGARRIALRALVAAEVFELLARLLAEQILDGVEDRARRAA